MKKSEIIEELNELISTAEKIKSQYGSHQTIFSKWENDVIAIATNVLKNSENKVSVFKGVNYNLWSCNGEFI